MEDAAVTGVAHDLSEVKLMVQGVPDHPGVASALFEPLSTADVNVDMIVQNTSHDGRTDISFTVPRADAERALDLAHAAAKVLEAGGVSLDDTIAKVSVVGAGMRTHPGIAATMFSVLAEAGINIAMISTSPVRVSCVIDAAVAEEAVRLLHDAFDPPFDPQEESA